MANNIVEYSNVEDKLGTSFWNPGRLGRKIAAWYDAADPSTIQGSAFVCQLGVLDLTANGGLNPKTGAPWAAGDQYRLAFVSSTTKDALSTDYKSYNAHVQAAADAAGLGSVEWRAFVSTPTVAAKDNCGLSAAYLDTSVFNFGDEIVGTDIADMFDTTSPSTGPTNKILYDENGNGPGLPDLPGSVPFNIYTPIWTGTGKNGDTENPVGNGGNVNFGICEAEKGYQ